MSDSILAFEDREVEIQGMPRTVLIARPQMPIRLDAQRLDRMRRSDFVSRVDMEILKRAADREGELAVVLFDAGDTPEVRTWAFDPDLEDEERMELGRLLLRSQVALYRELVRLGSTGLIGVGFGSLELSAFQRGTVRIVSELTEELESPPPPERVPQIEIDLWLMEHAAKWTGLALEDYALTKLADDVAWRTSKRPEIEALLAAAGE